MDPPPSNSDYKGIVRIILGSSYIPILPLLQGGGVLLRYRMLRVWDSLSSYLKAALTSQRRDVNDSEQMLQLRFRSHSNADPHMFSFTTRQQFVEDLSEGGSGGSF